MNTELSFPWKAAFCSGSFPFATEACLSPDEDNSPQLPPSGPLKPDFLQELLCFTENRFSIHGT
jgi:hypothetical protein